MSLLETLKLFLISLPVQCTTTYPTILIAFLSLPYKFLVFTNWKLFRPDLVAFVHGMSAWFSADFIHTKPANNLTYFVILDGVIPFERFVQLFEERVLNKLKSPAPAPAANANANVNGNITSDTTSQQQHHVKTATIPGENSCTVTNGNRRPQPELELVLERQKYVCAKTEVLERNTAKYPPLVYGKLRQYWTNFMGYNFWKWDDKFDLQNHIRIYKHDEDEGDEIEPLSRAPDQDIKLNGVQFKPRIYDKNDLPNIKRRLLAKPFKIYQSPWDIQLLYNYCDSREARNEKPESESQSEGEKMILILRVHHALADGYSLLKALQHDLPARTTPLTIAQPNYVKKSALNQFVNVMTCPYEISKIYTHSIDRANKWNLIFPFGVETSGKFCTSLTNPIPVRKIKDIKSHYGVSYLAVLMTAICGGIRRIMIDGGQTVPDFISFVCPLPKWGHPGGLTNHMKTTTIVLPTGSMATTDRLKIIAEQIRYEKTTMVRYVLTTYFELWGFLPTSLIRINQKCHLIPSFLVSNFPVPEQTTVIDGCPVSEFYVGYGTGFMNWGASIMMFGDGGKQSVVVTTDQALYPSQEKFNNLGRYIEEELQILVHSHSHSHQE